MTAQFTFPRPKPDVATWAVTDPDGQKIATITVGADGQLLCTCDEAYTTGACVHGTVFKAEIKRALQEKATANASGATNAPQADAPPTSAAPAHPEPAGNDDASPKQQSLIASLVRKHGLQLSRYPANSKREASASIKRLLELEGGGQSNGQPAATKPPPVKAAEWQILTDEERADPQTVYAALNAPFARVSTTEGNRYITARQCAERLDQVFGPLGWSTHYIVIDPRKGIVECTLTAGGVQRSEVGYCNNPEWSDEAGKSIKTDRSGNPLVEQERLKAAYSDALKRAGATMGIARYLYGDTEAARP